MKIVIAPDSFKGSCTAAQAADSIREGVLRVFPRAEIVTLPVADGGEGTVEAILHCAGGELKHAQVTGPLGEPVDAVYGITKEGVGVVEMAAASGLTLVPPAKRNPLRTTTRGTGELIRCLLDQNVRRMVIGIGGSATNDGGMGAAQALGVSFRDSMGHELRAGGGELERLVSIDTSELDPRLKECTLLVACDVQNPLCGPTGASAVYGPQKGASPATVQRLDAGLRHYANLLEKKYGMPVADVPGSGASGGLGVALRVFAGAKFASGIDTVLDSSCYDTHLIGTDIVITGEGRIDAQTAHGKVPYGTAVRAAKRGIPVVVLAGGIGEGAEAMYEFGVTSMSSIVPGPMRLEDSVKRAPELLANAAERVMRMVAAGMGIKG